MSATQHPLHRSVRARLPHTAPALGDDDQTLVGVGVADFGSRKLPFLVFPQQWVKPRKSKVCGLPCPVPHYAKQAASRR